MYVASESTDIEHQDQHYVYSFCIVIEFFYLIMFI